MPICKLCTKRFPCRVVINGKERNVGRRKYCLVCSPFQRHNTRTLENYGLLEDVNTKSCGKCKKQLPFSYFFERYDCPGLYHSYCRVCERIRNCERLRENKAKCIEYKGGKCQRCGYDKCYVAMDFHHLTDKKFGIAGNKWKDFEKLKVELDKCWLLCAVCHREHHAGVWTELRA